MAARNMRIGQQPTQKSAALFVGLLKHGGWGGAGSLSPGLAELSCCRRMPSDQATNASATVQPHQADILAVAVGASSLDWEDVGLRSCCLEAGGQSP